ncbi:MAG: hypothetical protein U5J96_04465 [Ignavibacteriaceae bacterium]|nr:hypothetical protein [Ignavibacteriaceae bacterium]
METGINCQHACKNTCASLNEASPEGDGLSLNIMKESLQNVEYAGSKNVVWMSSLRKSARLFFDSFRKLNEIHVRSQAIEWYNIKL